MYSKEVCLEMEETLEQAMAGGERRMVEERVGTTMEVGQGSRSTK